MTHISQYVSHCHQVKYTPFVAVNIDLYHITSCDVHIDIVYLAVSYLLQKACISGMYLRHLVKGNPISVS